MEIIPLTNHYFRIRSSVFESLEETCFEVLDKIFRQPSVKWVEVNTVTGSALVHYNSTFKISDFKNQFKKKKRNIDNSTAILPFGDISRVLAGHENFYRKIKFCRAGGMITNWEIIHDLPQRIRLHHPLLFKRSALCSQLEKMLSNTVGIAECKINSLTGNILVSYEQSQIDREKIVGILEGSFSDLSSGDKKEDEKKIGDFEISTTSFALSLAFPGVLFLTIPAVLYTGLPIFKKAFHALRQKKIKVDILDTVVIGGSLLVNQVAIAAFMVWVVALADKIQEKTSQSTGKLLSQIFGSQPRFAWLKQGEQEIQVAVANLKKDDVIIIHPGETIPIDGVIVEGESLVDQSILTGESQPAEKQKGDKVFACTTLISGEMSAKVEITGQETIAGKIQQVIATASAHKTKAHSIGERIADKAVLPTLALGGIGMMTGGSGVALAVVNSDFGTGIRVAAPTLLLSHLIMLARRGILVKNGEVLEKLNKVDVFIFDKTGTLTAEIPEITEIISLENGYSKEEILRCAAIAEQCTSHPIGKAIIQKAKEHNLSLPPREEAKCHIGRGVEVKLDGKNIKVGSLKYFEGEQVVITDEAKKDLDQIKKEGYGVVLVGIDNVLVGFIKLKTVPREDAYQIIQFLKSKGVKETILLSGDHKDVTAMIAKELGVDGYLAEVLPHEKADHVKKYKDQGKIVAMVGDGVNDGPALSMADISISLRGASNIAIDTAHIVFLDGNFEKIHLLFNSAEKFNKGVWSSFRLIAIPNALCILGALGHLWGLGMSLVLNNCFNVLATIKSLGPLYALEPITGPKLLLPAKKHKNQKNN